MDAQATNLKKDTEGSLRDLEAQLAYQSEAGVFRGREDEIAKISSQTGSAWKSLQGDEIADARSKTLAAHAQLNTLIADQKFGWRVLHLWFVHAVIYYVLIVAAFVYVEIVHTDRLDNTSIGVIPVQIFMYGFLGGMIRGIWWLVRKIQTRSLRPQFFIPYAASPWIGALLAAFAYLLLKAGLFIIASGEADSTVDPNKTLGMAALMTLCGFSWEFVMDRITKARNSL